MSKGSTQRPTDKESFDRNYDAIFGRKEGKKGDCQTTTEQRESDEDGNEQS